MTPATIYKTPAGKEAVLAAYDAILARWPVPHKTMHLPTRHGDTFTIISGNDAGQPLVLLHGAGSNSAIWMGDIEAYSRHHRVYAVDLTGEPGKSAPNRPDWEGPAYAEWLEDIFDALQIESATLIGTSQGAWTALKFATFAPERVDSLVLLTPGGITPDRLSFLVRIIPLSLLGAWGRKRISRMLFGSQPVPDEVEEFMTLVMTHFNSRMGILPLFSNEELRRLTMPVLVLIGAEDALRDGDKIIMRMREVVPNLTAAILPDQGHALVHTQDRILTFLRDTASSETRRELSLS